MSNVIPMPKPKSPQTEDGFVRIARELHLAILAYPLKLSAFRVLQAVIHKTYGYQKTEDDISASQIGALCGGMLREHVTRALNELASLRIILKRSGRYGSIIRVNKDYSQWVGWPNGCPDFRKKDSANLAHPGADFALEEQEDSHSEISANLALDSANSALADSASFAQVCKTEGADSANLAQVGSAKLAHTKDNLPKDNKTKEKNICAPQADRVNAKPARAGQTGRAMTAETQARFEKFYQAYPRKRSRGVAEKAFARINPDDELLETMLAAIEVAKRSEGWNNGYIPHPGSWLNAKGWLDHIDTAYSAVESEVIQAYNDALGSECGRIDPDIYTSARAGRIRDFLTLSPVENFWKAYFPWVRDRCNLPTHVGFDYLISRDGFSKVKGGMFQVDAP
ncbi:replication protein [Candidimonas humi]|uniref:Replication protein n=1 Tax=Candidimonas humi TaxID=683355 RepID=A0ABV8NYV3_9BURK|nr:replication protein [Candidimonas humi]MBV6304916.1 replication protein [Candidimonas humi]